MEKAYDKQDLNRFFNGIKSKYVIPRTNTNVLGKVTCRNGLEYIEKPYSNSADVKCTRNHSRLSRQRKYWSCGHYSSVTNPYRTLGEIVLDPKKLTLRHFNSQMGEKDVQDLASSHLIKWKNATKVVFPIVRMNAGDAHISGEYDNLDQGLPPVEQKQNRRRRQEFVVHQGNWPKIQSTGFQQLSAAVDKTNKRVSATRGTNPYFEVVDTDYDIGLEDTPESGLIEDSSITQPVAIDIYKKERTIKRLEAFIYVLDALFNIKTRDLRNKRHVQHEKELMEPSFHQVPTDDKPAPVLREKTSAGEQSPHKGFTWNDGIPPWQKIKQENEFLAAPGIEQENVEPENDMSSPDGKDQEFLLGLRKDFVAMQERLDSHLNYRIRRILRDGREKFIRRFHALKLAPTLSLGMVDVRRVDRTSRVVDQENNKSSSKQEWFIEAVEDLELARYSEDSKINSLIEQFERYSHSDLLEEIKSLKAKLCYLTMSMPVPLVLQPDYQYAIKFIIMKCLAVHEDVFGSWFKMRFKKGKLTAMT